MTLIKAHEVASISSKVRPLASPRRPPTLAAQDQVVPVELAALRREVESLSGRLSERTSEIERLRQDVSRAYREGEAEGRKAGLRELDKRRAEQLERLDAGIERAIDRFAQELASLERLAALVALEGLEKILGDPARYAELLAQVIRRQVDDLDANRILRIEVSSEDFDDPAQVHALATNIGRRGLDVQTTDDLGSGDCRIKLALGSLEVGIAHQWSRLKPSLAALAAPEAVQ
ncbi:MAG: hypothetical protein ACHP84_00995 [Caulobacterales bacterium]